MRLYSISDDRTHAQVIRVMQAWINPEMKHISCFTNLYFSHETYPLLHATGVPLQHPLCLIVPVQLPFHSALLIIIFSSTNRIFTGKYLLVTVVRVEDMNLVT